jgi:hypothetical protein
LATDRTNGAALRAEVALPSPANDPTFESTKVKVLVLADSARRVPRDNEHLKKDELWVGDAFDPFQPQGASTSIYMRVGEPHAIVAELLCAVVARALGLPAAEPFLVIVEPGTLGNASKLDPTVRHYCVGSRDIGGNTFTQLLCEGSNTVTQILQKWEHLIGVTALDEWLANPDRNMGNLLWVANTVHIIDHAEAFGGSARQLFPLEELTEDMIANKLAHFLDASTPTKRQQVLDKANNWITFTAGALDAASAIAIAGVGRWQTPQQQDELLKFMHTRLRITHRLLCQRMGLPQLQL